VPAVTVVKHFDPLFDGFFDGSLRSPRTPINQVFLETGEETFGYRVVPTITGSVGKLVSGLKRA
jgi:hypothetical protein